MKYIDWEDVIMKTILWVLGFLAVLCLIGMILSVIDQPKQKQLAYSAYIKSTGNPGNLTFEEWYALKEATRPRDTHSTVIMPMPIGGR